MILGPETLLYGLQAAFVYLIFKVEADLPHTICLALTVSSIVLGAGIAAAATYILPLNFFQSTAGLGGLMFVMGSAYAVLEPA